MPETKEWTLMFYMASDNPLVISIVSQLKALKSAGFHHDVNVVAQFDPYAEGTPTHIFDVNLINKLTIPTPNIGFDDEDSFVRNLIEDRLWRDEKTRRGREVRTVLNEVMLKKHHVPYVAPLAPEMNGNGTNGHDGKHEHSDARQQTGNGNPNGEENGRPKEPGPFVSLQKFLYFCHTSYPAKHYMLFVIGHGVVVGNDIFLLDEHAEENSITLENMGKALAKFRQDIDKKGATFELVSFNSCSVSSLEVAYQLKGTANYMLASQGPTFVGSWPYREILIRIFKEVDQNRNDIRDLISDIFHYCVYNSSDFLLAGYSYQLTLCDLKRVSDLDESITKLSTALITALSPDDKDKNHSASTFIILYAHWKSQSFFEEMYTDLYDFCFCIVDRCERIEEAGGEVKAPLSDIRDACGQIMTILAKPEVQKDKRRGRISSKQTIVTASDFVGPAYQYSRGLSVYFPWTRPAEDSEIMEQYKKTYRFHTDFKAPNRNPGSASWLDFLEAYFKVTERFTKRDELLEQQKRQQKKSSGVIPLLEQSVLDQGEEHELQEDIGNLVYNGEGPLGGFALAKTDPRDKTGDDCKCPSFKNYPRDTRSRGQKRKQAQPMPLSDTLLGQFTPRSD